MKKFLILLLAAMILFSGCVGQKTVKNGSNISVDYIGTLPDGKVFDTSIEKIAEENNISNPGREYKPLNFIVGKGKVFDEGVVGMKVGETKTITIPPEKAYPINPSMIQVIPVIEVHPANETMPRKTEFPLGQFKQLFGSNHTVGDTVKFQNTNINLTITNITSEVSLTYDLKVGNNVWDARLPWNKTVIKVDDKNIILRTNVTKNQIFKFPNIPWNTTVIDINSTNITIRHEPIPATTITVPGMSGQKVSMKISFNETSVIIDQNPEFAGKALTFNVTLISINK